jgi:hypothetical protein
MLMIKLITFFIVNVYMKRVIYIGIVLLFFGNWNLFSQELYDYGFVKDVSIVVMRADSSPFLYPFTGGMNNMQFGWLDCNRDGVKDLVAFDVHGARVLPFLKTVKGYEYAPHYAHYFPQMTGFMQLIDFDNDGKEDIFTYHEAGIKVYRNISTTNLQFELFTEQILSVYNPDRNPINLFCTEGDYVVIRDMDGDGDLDILAFWSLGKYVDYHKNKSMEQYGSPAYLTFELEDRCWGLFSESNEYNAIILNDDCKKTPVKAHRHTGSTMLSFDENGNGLPDLLLGDMDYPNLMLLTNGGNANTARMVSKDSLFPSYDTPVRLYSMPCPMLMDVDGDGLEDLLVSPFDLALTKSENKESIWFYKNTGTHQSPHFVLQTKSFLQENMLDFGSGAYPVFHDMDGDGLLDLLIGNYGYYDSTTTNGYSITCYYSAAVAYFKNIGSKSNPIFSLVTEDLADLRKWGYTSLIPSVGDLNGDGKPDILLGTATNKLIYLENNSASSNIVTFSSPVFNYKSLSVADYAAVQIFDLDKDGLPDLITGNKNGKISYYRNTGTITNPAFTLLTDSLGKINVRDFDYSYFGYATPCFFRTNADETRLFVASEKGAIAYYKNIDNNLNGAFSPDLNELFFMADSSIFPIREGIRTALAVGDINDDGYLDVMAGNYAGGISFYKGAKPPKKTLAIRDIIPKKASSVQIFPNPAMERLYFRCFSSSGASVKSVYIYDIMGRCRLQKEINGKKEDSIDVSSFATGLYIIKFVFDNDAYMMKKFLKD